MRAIYVDYNRYGNAKRMTLLLSVRERAGLKVGERVVLEGDGTEGSEGAALIRSIDGSRVTIEVIDTNPVRRTA